MRVVALIAAYNERRFIEFCLSNLHTHGIESYLIDNESTDETVKLAERWIGRGLIGIESFPRGNGDLYNWRDLLVRKEELARELDADWLLHTDPDEVRLPPASGNSLSEALEKVNDEGFNAVDFTELTFVPTCQEPDHDHSDFQRTLRTYYPLDRGPHWQLKAWKASDAIELAWSGGHTARFPGLRPFPHRFPMKHYLFLSVPHAIEKYVRRRYDPAEVRIGWHVWRSKLQACEIALPDRSDLRIAHSDAELDTSEPRSSHYLAALVGSGPNLT
jgi:glycosyltransferase involved in cell wall biosynthesis